MGIIYTAYCTANDKWYVGQTSYNLDKRRQEHESEARGGCEYPFHCAIRAYGEHDFLWAVWWTGPNEELNEQERRAIKLHNSQTRGNGYNCDAGGTSRGRHSLKTIAKMSEGQRRAAKRRRDTGYQYVNHSWERTPQMRERARQTQTGKRASEATKQKMSKTRLDKGCATVQRWRAGELEVGQCYDCEDGIRRRVFGAGKQGTQFIPVCTHDRRFHACALCR